MKNPPVIAHSTLVAFLLLITNPLSQAKNDWQTHLKNSSQQPSVITLSIIFGIVFLAYLTSCIKKCLQNRVRNQNPLYFPITTPPVQLLNVMPRIVTTHPRTPQGSEPSTEATFLSPRRS